MLKTWTVCVKDLIAVVTADDVDVAANLIYQWYGVRVSNEDLIPCPTHHRYVRVLSLEKNDGNRSS